MKMNRYSIVNFNAKTNFQNLLHYSFSLKLSLNNVLIDAVSHLMNQLEEVKFILMDSIYWLKHQLTAVVCNNGQC